MKTKSLVALFIAVLLAFTLCACNSNDHECSTVPYQQDDIVILFTNDIHCAFETEIGFSGLSAFKTLALEKTPHVTLVDLGDAIQGEVIGTISKGEYIVDMMNKVGYDFAVFGNHEFDYGIDRLVYLADKAEYEYLNCNITYSGSGNSAFNTIKPYKLMDYGETTVAFIGVTTPETLTSSTTTYFMEDGKFVYGFSGGENGNTLYSCVQGYVDECREKGADYVILLTHLGDLEESSPYTSVEVINNTNGVDAVLDAHAHSVIPSRVELNKDGNTVLLASTGTKFQNIGQLVISSNGYITAGLISDFNKKDEAIETFVAELKSTYEGELNKVVGTTDIQLTITDSEGIRLVRSRETPIGNLCADAYRFVTGADVALVNGGGIRDNLPQGDITYANIIAVHPFGNKLCVVEATGQEIIDSLEIASRATKDIYKEDGYAVGEEGSFQHVSGLKYTIDTSIPSGVVFDENGMFLEFTGQRRVTDVQILNDDGTYSPIDPNAVYTVASHNYLIKSSGGGITMFSDNELIINEGVNDYEVLVTYIVDHLCGDLGSKYADTEGRITVK